MRKALICIILICASTANAATSISFTMSQVYAVKLLQAFEAQDDCFVTITFRGSQNAEDPNEPDYSAGIQFRTPVRDPADTAQVYAKKRIALLIDAVRLAHEEKLFQDALKVYNMNAPVSTVEDPNTVVEE